MKENKITRFFKETSFLKRFLIEKKMANVCVEQKSLTRAFFIWVICSLGASGLFFIIKPYFFEKKLFYVPGAISGLMYLVISLHFVYFISKSNKKYALFLVGVLAVLSLFSLIFFGFYSPFTFVVWQIYKLYI